MTKIYRNIILVIFTIILSVFTVLPLFHAGFFDFHDNTQVVRVFEMGKSLEGGMLPVRWVPDLGYGYGYPIFNFYGPLPYYIGGIANIAGFNALLATKIMFAIGIIISGITMFFLSNRFFGNLGGVVSSVIYMYFPYHAVNIYVRGAVDEFFAYAFLPIVFLGLFELVAKAPKKLASISNYYLLALISIGIFLVSVSHNLSIFMLLLLLVPYFFMSVLLVKQKKNYVVFLIVAVFFGILLSSFYILPAFLEMKYTDVASQVGGGANFSDHYVCINQYWNSMWGFGGSVKGCMDGLSFKLGKTNLLFLLVSVSLFVVAVLRKKVRVQEKTVFISFCLLLISAFLTLSISDFIWKTTPYMQFIQYPWRFINFIGLFIAFIVGYILFCVRELWGKEAQIITCAVVIISTIILNYKLFTPQYFNNNTSAFYTNENYIKYSVSKISDEYMPIGFDVPKKVSDLPVSDFELIGSSGETSLLIKRPGLLRASYNIDNSESLHINKAYFPAWKAYVNNKLIPIDPTPNGMNIMLPKGSGTIELIFKQTMLEVTANAISVISFLLLLVGIIVRQKNYLKKR